MTANPSVCNLWVAEKEKLVPMQTNLERSKHKQGRIGSLPQALFHNRSEPDDYVSPEPSFRIQVSQNPQHQILETPSELGIFCCWPAALQQGKPDHLQASHPLISREQ